MTATLRTILVLVTGSMLLTGCAESTRPVATGKGNIRGINAIVTSPDVNFLIEERLLDDVQFKTSSPMEQYDDLSYIFNFDLFVPGQIDPQRIASQPLDVVAGMDYILVLIGTIAAPEVLVWEDPIREWDGSETVFELRIAHLAPGLADVDIYFAPTGTPPVLGNAIATVAYRDRTPAMDVQDMEHEFIVTPRDDPATILFQSNPLSIAPQSQALFVMFDDDPSTTSSFSATLINGVGTSIAVAEINSPPQTRGYHTVFGEVAYDLYLNQDFTAPVIADVGFGEVSAYADFPAGTNGLTFTEAGNPGTILLDASDAIGGNNRSTVIFTGQTGNVGVKSLLDNARPLETQASVRISQLSFNITAINVYIEAAGTVIDEDTIPRFPRLPALLDTGFIGFEEGSHEITLTLPDEITPIAPVLTLDVLFGDTIDVAILDTVDPAAADLVVFDRN